MADWKKHGKRNFKIHNVISCPPLVRQTGGGHTLEFVYDTQGRPMTLVYDGTAYTYMLNLQGDVIALLDSSGGYAAWYVYDAWGKVLTVSGSNTTLANANPLRYRGYYYDTETGLYYLQSRYYDPVVKRFINCDEYASTAQGFIGYNPFAYCLNNPVSLIDVNGTLTETVVAAIVGGVTGAISGAFWGGITAAASGGNIATGMLSGALSGAVSGAFSGAAKPIAIFVGTVSSVVSYWATSNNPTVGGAITAAAFGAVNGAISSAIDFKDVGAAGIAISSHTIGGATSVLSTIGTTITDTYRPQPKAPSVSTVSSKSKSQDKVIVKPNPKDPSRYPSRDPAARIPLTV